MKKRRVEASEELPKKRRHLSEIKDQKYQNEEAVRCGKITQILLKNFMCHSNLKIELCNRVNLLIGANGSGKSAILTALVVGLGSKARDTNRSTSIKQLVKSGEPSADVEITILNAGKEGYESDTYGNLITICRHIMATGTSSYKIKDSRGNVISKKVEDLHKILLYHNIQTDNPVFVLNQDSARTFLKEMEPSKNYILFLKATQIETILEKLNQCGVMYQDFKYRLSCYKKQLEIMEEELNELKEKRERLEGADKIKNKVKYHKLEILWLKVQKQEVLVDNLKEEINKLEKKYDKMKKMIEEKDEAEATIKRQISDYDVELNNKNQSFRTKLLSLNQFKEMCIDATNKFKEKEHECEKLRKKVVEYKKNIQAYELKLEEHTEGGLTQVQKLRAENEQKLIKLEKAKEDIVILVNQRKRELDLMNETKTPQEEDFESLNRQRRKIEEKIVSMENEKLKITSSAKNQFAGFGPQMSDFIAELNRQRNRFSKLPIGPIGQYVFVEKQKWRGPIELLLGNLLTCFIVNNDKDCKTFTLIKNRFPSVKNPVITMKFHDQVYDVGSGMCDAPDGTALLMDEITCDNPVIMNCLIDRGKIETILLTENQKLAVNLTAFEDNIPHHLSRVILLKPFLEYYPAPNYRAYSLQERVPRFIQVNMDEIRKQLENEIENLKGAKSAAEENLRNKKVKLAEIYRQIKKNQDQLAKDNSKLTTIDEKIVELKSFEYPEETQIEFFKKEIEDLQKLIETLQEKIKKSEEEAQNLLQLKVDKTKQLDEQKTDLKKEEEAVNELKKSIDNLKSQLHSLSNTANSGQQNLKNLKKDIEENSEKLIVENQTLQTLTESAESEGERIKVTKSEEELKNLIKKYELSIKQILQTNENLSDIILLIEDKQQKYDKFALLTTSLVSTLELLKRSRLQRFKFIVNLKTHMALRVKFTFDSVLKIKNFTGNIEFNHSEQKLSLSVVPRDNHIDNAVSNTKSLSGGERSFTTVALLLSLWSCVDHPFYFLDEYDVFTDQINREIMTKLLLSEAERKPHRQYTFLTPQDVSFVQASDTVVIHRLHPPTR